MHQAVQGDSVIQTYCTKTMGIINAWRSSNEQMFLFCDSLNDVVSNLPVQQWMKITAVLSNAYIALKQK